MTTPSRPDQHSTRLIAIWLGGSLSLALAQLLLLMMEMPLATSVVRGASLVLAAALIAGLVTGWRSRFQFGLDPESFGLRRLCFVVLLFGYVAMLGGLWTTLGPHSGSDPIALALKDFLPRPAGLAISVVLLTTGALLLEQMILAWSEYGRQNRLSGDLLPASMRLQVGASAAAITIFVLGGIGLSHAVVGQAFFLSAGVGS